MKYIILILISLSFVTLMSTNTASSLPFSYSYLQRSIGVEANYWNPANLHKLPTNNEIMVIPFTFSAKNNAVSLKLYNDVTGTFINENKKREILNSIDGSMNVSMNLNLITFGYANKNWALSSATNFVANGKIDENYLELLLMGNEYNRDYIFTKDNNDFAALGYQDLTFSYGNLLINNWIPSMKDYRLPDIYMGVGVSALIGLYSVEMNDFYGVFTSSDNGLYLDQKATVRMGSVGTGYKFSWGLSSEVVTFEEDHYISAGLALNNILGTIKWSSETEMREYIAKIDSVYVNELDEDIFNDEEIVTEISAYSTKLPINIKLGANYQYRDFSCSLDFAKNSDVNPAFNSDATIALGTEYIIMDMIPIQLGYRLASGDLPALYSFGLGLKFQYFECGFGYQSIGAFFLSEESQGLAFSGQMKFRF
ncbi:MAG: hypothetical protein M0Q94_05770 [Candidatus Cloacimonetes bacterium]|nr:hypothetical protein [Candidatus Cloacimonadota bacterium]